MKSPKSSTLLSGPPAHTTTTTITTLTHHHAPSPALPALQGTSGGWVFQISAARSWQPARELQLPSTNHHIGAATYAFLFTLAINEFAIT
jgi:hypothetical protein